MAGTTTDFRRLLADAQSSGLLGFDAHVNPEFSKMLRLTGFDRSWVRGSGALLWDAAGREYIDCFAGFAVHGIGRNHPAMIAALTEALEAGSPNWVQFERNALAGLLATRLCERVDLGLDRVFFSNSGTEAVECAMKLARRATGRSGVLHCSMSFHGLTLGSLAANGNPHLRVPFGDLGESQQVPFNDLPALERALESRRFAAFIVEPVQGKTCQVVDPQYLSEASRLCRRAGTLLIADEIQTGIGRTGRFLATHHDADALPDMVVLSKALSGGYIPIGATLVRSDIWAKTFDSMANALLHASTFQGGILAMIAALMTLEIVDRENLSSAALERGRVLRAGLEECVGRHRVAAEVRRRGLMLGLALRKSATEEFMARMPLIGALERLAYGQAFVMEMLERHGVLAQVSDSKSNLIKFTPPLVINGSQCGAVLAAVDATLGRLGRGPAATVHGTVAVLRNLVRSRPAVNLVGEPEET